MRGRLGSYCPPGRDGPASPPSTHCRSFTGYHLFQFCRADFSNRRRLLYLSIAYEFRQLRTEVALSRSRPIRIGPRGEEGEAAAMDVRTIRIVKATMYFPASSTM